MANAKRNYKAADEVTDADLARVVRIYTEDHVSLKRLSMTTNISPKMVKEHLDSLGLIKGKSRITPDDKVTEAQKATLKRRYVDEESTIREAGFAANVSERYASKYLNSVCVVRTPGDWAKKSPIYLRCKAGFAEAKARREGRIP